MKDLLKIDSSARFCDAETQFLMDRLHQHEIAVDALSKSVQIHQEATQLLKQEVDRLFTSWQDEVQKRQKAESSLQAGKWAGWLTASALAVTTGVLTIIVIAK